MEQFSPKVLENREFVDFEEEDIQKLNRQEADKFDNNPNMPGMMRQIESEIGNGGRWEEHWLTVDTSGRRVYSRIYYTQEQAVAIVADGQIIREITYPKTEGKKH